MQSTSFRTSGIVLIAICMAGTLPARAAYLNIDDFSVPGQVTVGGGDFEYGVNINGQLAAGIGQAITVTATSASPVTFYGSWIDDNASTPGSFAQVSADDALIYRVAKVGGNGATITGEFCSDPTACAIPPDAIVSNVGEGPNIFNQAYLSASWQSDPVPEPAGVLMFGAALGGLSIVRRQRSIRSHRCR